MAIRTWSRRRFLRAAALSGVASLAVRRSIAAGSDWSGEFARALEADPMLLGWSGARADRYECVARVEGRLPQELRGTFYRNGPAVHERFGLRYRHLFDGDGMIHAFRFDGRGLTHRARVLATPKLVRETEAQRRLYPGFGTEVHGGTPARRPDELNTANTSVLDHHGELLALWEGGSASVFDPDTLAWQGFKVWDESLRGVPFTAHPKVEADGTLWAFGVNLVPVRALVLYHIAPDGTLVKALPVDAGPLGFVHDFVVTGRHLVIVIPPLVYDPDRSGGPVLDALVWRPALGSRVLVVDKDDFSARRWHQLPAAFGFHHGNGWEDSNGVIHYDHCVAGDPTLMTATMRGIMRGEPERGTPERYTRFTLRPGGHADIETTGEEEEFPRVAPAVTGRRNRYVYTMGPSSDRAGGLGLRRVIKRDLESGALDSFDYGSGVIAEEHVFVPRPAPRGEDDGWHVGPFLDYARGVTGVGVFDAREVAGGPVARAWLDYPVPLAFHGNFSPG